MKKVKIAHCMSIALRVALFIMIAIDGNYAIAQNSPTSMGVSIPTRRPIVPRPPPTPAPTSENLVPNPQLASATTNPKNPDHWHIGGYGTNTRTFSYPTAGINGGTGASVSIAEYTSGDAKWYFDNAPVTPFAIYAFSDSYNATIASTLTVQFTATDGTLTYVNVGTFPATNGIWETANGTITVPGDVTALTMFHLIQGVGSLTTTNYSLTLTSPASANVFPKGLVSITLDDGYESQYDNAIPVLETKALPATFYIITKAMAGGDNSAAGYMNQSRILLLQQAGMEIGDHTVDHCNLVALYNNPSSATILPTLPTAVCPDAGPLTSPTTAQQEIDGARTTLLKDGLTPVSTFAYPYGDYNANIEALVKADGMIAARTTNTGYNLKTSDPYALAVHEVNATVTDPATVEAWIDYAAKNKVWLILLFHQVQTPLPSADVYGTTTEIFQSTSQYLVEQRSAGNVDIDTMSNIVIKYMRRSRTF